MIFALYLLLIALTILHPFEALAPDLAAYRPALVLSLVVLGLTVADALRTRRMAAQPRHLLMLAGFMAAIAVSKIMSGWPGGAIPSLVEFSSPALLFVSSVLVVTDIRRLRATCAVIVLCMVLLSIAGICAYHYGFMRDDLVVAEHGADEDHLVAEPADVIPAQDTSGARLWRIHSWGFLSDPNDFSQAIVMSLPMLMGAWIRRRKLRNLLRVWVPCALLVYASYLSHSRGAVLGLGVVMLFGLMRRYGGIRAAILLGLFGVAAIVAGFTGGRGFSSGGESAGGRIDAWSEGMQLLRSNPLFGVGYGNFTEHFQLTAHNSFVLCFSELGLIGYFFWVGLIVLVFRELTQAAALSAPDSEEKRWAVLLRLSLLGFLTCAWFLSRTYQPTLYILLAIGISAAHCARSALETGAKEPPPAVRWPLATAQVMFASIFIVYLIVRFQYAFVR
ncbi:MAG: O-antigen ligase family protein [Xanthomonadales bacterium]|nr:O-antigen ligase family protein [Xanthomonadales bacterium]MCB1577564.1 O-antigen ligase family protein [Xanthomonadales bacterium]